MSEKTKPPNSKRYLSTIGEGDDEDFNNAPNVLSDDCMTKIAESIEWVVDFCNKVMAKNKNRGPSSEEGLKEDDSESDIHPAFRKNRTTEKAPFRSNGRAGATTIRPRSRKTGQRSHHEDHQHPEVNNENPRQIKRTMSLVETRSIHEEGIAEFNKARSGSTGNRRRCGITREVIGRFESVQRKLNSSPSRLLRLDSLSSSLASNSRTDQVLPPLSWLASPLTWMDYDKDFSVRTAPLRRRQNQGQEARNYGTNDDAMRRLSCGKMATIPPICPPHQGSAK